MLEQKSVLRELPTAESSFHMPFGPTTEASVREPACRGGRCGVAPEQYAVMFGAAVREGPTGLQYVCRA